MPMIFTLLTGCASHYLATATGTTDGARQLEMAVKQYRFGEPYCQQAEGSLAWSAAQLESPIGALQLGTVVSDFTCQESVVTLKGGQKLRR